MATVMKSTNSEKSDRRNIYFFFCVWFVVVTLVLILEGIISAKIQGIIGDLLAGGFYLIALLQAAIFYFVLNRSFGESKGRTLKLSIIMFFLPLVVIFIGYMILFSFFAGGFG